MAKKIRVVLPDKYDLVVGDTFQLFYRGVIEAPNPYAYSIVCTCAQGKSFPRYYEYTPTEPGQHKLTLQVVDADFTVLGSGETTLNVVAPKAPDKPLNILCIGDSLTQGGHWVSEVNRRIVSEDGAPAGLGFENAVKFLGRPAKDVFCEGYGGWHWESFLTSQPGAMWIEYSNNISAENQHSIWRDVNGALWQLETLQVDYLKFNRYKGHTSPVPTEGPLVHEKNAVDTAPMYFKSASSAGGSPFFDPELGEINFKTYAARNGIETIDAVYVLLGCNGLMGTKAMSLSRKDYCQVVVDWGKQLIGKLKEAFPNVQVRIMGQPGHSVNGGMGASYGAELPLTDSYEISHYEKELDLAYQAWCKEDGWKDFMEFINLSGQFDVENSMPTKLKPVNTRSEVTEIIGTNGAHPTLAGYMQIADAVYRNVISSFMCE